MLYFGLVEGILFVAGCFPSFFHSWLGTFKLRFRIDVHIVHFHSLLLLVLAILPSPIGLSFASVLSTATWPCAAASQSCLCRSHQTRPSTDAARRGSCSCHPKSQWEPPWYGYGPRPGDPRGPRRRSTCIIYIFCNNSIIMMRPLCAELFKLVKPS